MIDLRVKGELPRAIEVDGNSFSLNTDFRVWIRFYDDYINKRKTDLSYLFVDNIPNMSEEVIYQLAMFLFCPNATPNVEGGSNDKILDYILDGEYIFSALYATYHIDITEIDMHWYKFLALCNNIRGNSTLWGFAKSMRGHEKQSKNYSQEKEYARLKREWSFPIELSEEEQKIKEQFDDYFS